MKRRDKLNLQTHLSLLHATGTHATTLTLIPPNHKGVIQDIPPIFIILQQLTLLKMEGPGYALFQTLYSHHPFLITH